MSSLARLRPTFPAPAIIAYMALDRLRLGVRLERALEHLDRVLGRRDRVQALFAVPAGARRVHHPDDRLLDLVALLRDPRDHEFLFVARGRGDEYVGALD